MPTYSAQMTIESNEGRMVLGISKPAKYFWTTEPTFCPLSFTRTTEPCGLNEENKKRLRGEKNSNYLINKNNLFVRDGKCLV